MKEQVANYIDRSKLPDEVEPLKDIVVTLSQALFKLWEEIDVLKAENVALRAENAILREEIKQLRSENAVLRIENAKLREENAYLKARNEILTEEVNLLKQKVFGSRKHHSQKKSLNNTNQNHVNQNRSKHPGRQTPSDDLPREEVVYDINASQKVCFHCQGFLSLIGEEASEQLELVRSYFKVIKHHRLKYACKSCCQCVVLAPAPYKPLEKGLAGPNLMAHVIVNKMSDHLPLYRQEKMLRRYGINLNRSTLCQWLQKVASGLKPLYDAMKQELIATDHIFADETPLLTLRVPTVTGKTADQTTSGQKKSSRKNVSNKAEESEQDADVNNNTGTNVTSDSQGKATCRGYIWAYGREGSHGCKPLVVYDFTLSRSGIHVQEFLGNFKGYLQTDAYSGYNRMRLSKKAKARKVEGECISVGCWAHVLRKFEEALISRPNSPVKEVIELIRLLYDKERYAKAKALDVKGIQELRQRESQPILKKIDKWLKKFTSKTLPKSHLGRAISYTQNNWQALTEYIKDGRLSIDNNFSERNIKLAVMGRKNYLFAGSKRGGESNLVFIDSDLRTK